MESGAARQIGTRMKRSAASAGQLARASAASSTAGALHSPSQRTAAVDTRVGAPNEYPARPPQRAASMTDGTELTRAVAARYVGPDRSTVMTDMQTALAGNGDTPTSSTSAIGSARMVARRTERRALAAPAAITRVTASQPATATATRAPGRNAWASATNTTAPSVSALAASRETRSTRHASTSTASNTMDRRL